MRNDLTNSKMIHLPDSGYDKMFYILNITSEGYNWKTWVLPTRSWRTLGARWVYLVIGANLQSPPRIKKYTHISLQSFPSRLFHEMTWDRPDETIGQWLSFLSVFLRYIKSLLNPRSYKQLLLVLFLPLFLLISFRRLILSSYLSYLSNLSCLSQLPRSYEGCHTISRCFFQDNNIHK